jgi:phosphomannomutase
VPVEDLGRIAAIMARLRGQAPRALGGDRVVEASDLAAGAGDLPPADALVYLTAAGDRVIVRPSGTEPRLKCYLEVVEPVRDRDVTRARTAAVARMTALRSDVRALLGS